jgi:hypothetical protein
VTIGRREDGSWQIVISFTIVAAILTVLVIVLT